MKLVDRLELDGYLLRRVDLAAQSAADVHLSQGRLDDADLSGSRLTRMKLEDVAVVRGSWANAGLPNSRLRRVTFGEVRMTGVDLASASLKDVSFTECRIDLASFRFAKLERVLFDRCRMEEIDFYGADLRSVTFLRCVMTKASWAEATLTQSEMRGTDISGAGNPERLRGIRMPWASSSAPPGNWQRRSGLRSWTDDRLDRPGSAEARRRDSRRSAPLEDRPRSRRARVDIRAPIPERRVQQMHAWASIGIHSGGRHCDRAGGAANRLQNITG